MRVVLAGGGTGGHVIPALAIAEELRDHYAADVLFLGTARGIETRLVPAAGFKLKLVEVGALKSVSLSTKIATLWALPRAVWRSAAILRQFSPGVVIGVGGYASGPAMLAAILKGIPTLAFESNTVPGFANRVIAPLVSATAVQFEETARSFRRAHVTGIPVRKEFFDLKPRAYDGGQNYRPTLLIFGGSQGASAINRTMIAALPALIAQAPASHFIHQTGARDYNEVRSAYLEAGVSAEVYEFIDHLPEAFGRADLLLCRSGASTVGEIAAAGKPAIFIPFPRATDNHQLRNAETLRRLQAAVTITEDVLTPEKLAETISTLLQDRKGLQRMGAAAHTLAHPGAASAIAALAAGLESAGETKARKSDLNPRS